MTPIRLTLDHSPMCNTTTCTQTHVHVHVWCFVLLQRTMATVTPTSFYFKKVNKLNWRKSIIRQYFYSMVQCLYLQWFVCTRADMLINSYKTYGPEDHVHRSTDVRPVQWMTVLAGSSGEKIQFRVLNMRKNQWI